MKKGLTIVITLMLSMPLLLPAQSYSALWKQYDETVAKDLPQSALQQLERIMAKTDSEKRHGDYLKALTERVMVQGLISPDSLNAELKRLDERAAQERDTVRRAILNAVMYQAMGAYIRSYTFLTTKDEYRRRATEHPHVLAATSAKGYAPFVEDGIDSGIFNGDLFSVICLETAAYDAMHAYYKQSDNRRAACISAMLQLKHRKTNPNDEDWRTSTVIAEYDSLIAEYADVDVVAEMAIERSLYLGSHTNATRADVAADIDRTLVKYGSWKTAGELVYRRKLLTRPTINCSFNSADALPMRPTTVHFEQITNIQQVTTRVYRLNVDGRTNLSPYSKKDLNTLMRQAKMVKEATVTRTYRDFKDYDIHSDSTQIPALPVGVYLVEFITSPSTDISKTLLHVSGVTCIAQELPEKKIRYVVVDAATSQPLPHAKLDIMLPREDGKAESWITRTCNENGEVVFDYSKQWPTRTSSQPEQVFPYTKTDRAARASDLYPRYQFYNRQDDRMTCEIFTDRSIYRPGQTIRMSMVAKRGTKHATVVAGEKIKLFLQNPNRSYIADKEVVTDSFGGASAEFVLPANAITGRYYIATGTSSSSTFCVEEYKRPTFRVDIDEVKETYKGNDTLHLRGRAESFAGIGIKGGKVSYDVVRKPMLWWRSYLDDGETMRQTEVYSSTATTDDDGTFEIVMPLTMPEGRDNIGMFFNFEVNAHVTDIAGETRSGNISLPLGTRNAHLSSNIAAKNLVGAMKDIRFTLRNAAGKEVESTVRFRLNDEKEWREASTAEPYTFAETLASGRYDIEATAAGDTLKQQFVVFSLDDKRPCVPSDEWFYTSATAFPADGTPITVQVGTSNEDAHVVYTMMTGDSLLESGAFRLSDENLNRKLTYRPEYGEGIVLAYAWVKNGRLHTYETSIESPKVDKHLQLKWTTFRDRLTPGAHEEWRLNISNSDGTPAEARLIATLYDKSLDAIYDHSWHLPTAYTSSIPSSLWTIIDRGDYFGHGYVPLKRPNITPLRYAHFYELPFSYMMFGFQAKEVSLVVGYSNAKTSNLRMAKAMMDMESVGAEDIAADGMSTGRVLREQTIRSNSAQGAEHPQSSNVETAVQPRENFNETAFFAPSVITDEKGEAVLRFTLPESVTTWRFMGLAHTKDVRVGMLESEAIAKKDVMVMPNIPRFVRVGDEANITTRIVNTSDNDISGTVKMELLDPETEAVVHSEMQTFEVEKDRTTNASFAFQPDDSRTLLVCRITAMGASFSDGEQHYLPVLPEMEMITKTVPVTMHSAGTQTIALGKLFPTTDRRNMLTVEYMEDPSWLMVQSLPTVGTPREKNAIEQCAAFYANTIAAHLLAERPQMKGIFELWRRETGNEKTLESSLSKNQTLKDIIIDETPWTDDARWESEQKQRLADFFDPAAIDSRLQNTLAQLRKLQNKDGSWSWWEGMKGSYYMTVSVAELLTRLNTMAGEQKQTATMLDKAYTFIYDKMVECVKEMKESEKRGYKPSSIGMNELRVLYIDALRNTKAPAAANGNATNSYKQSAEVKNAISYLLPILEKDVRNQSIYDKAMTAIVLNKHGRVAKSREYAKSLREYSVFTNDMGRYYDTPRAKYSWFSYKIPTQVMAIEALCAVTPDDSLTIEEMRRWLLQEKRTQLWGNAINNADAISAFFNGASTTRHSASETTISLDGQPLDMPKSTAAIGYSKTTVSNPRANTLTIEKTSNGTSWGAVYAQFMQKATETETQSSGISIKREIIVVSQPDQPSAAKHSNNTTSSLKVGSRIVVRLTIDAARDLDFVQVSDRRAACMEPTKQLSGYRNGYYCSPKDNVTNYFFDMLSKGKHVIETEYYIDRAGTYTTGTCTAGCAYAPEFRATTGGVTIVVKE